MRPFDDVPRLIFADRLEEQGDPDDRYQFIRNQLADPSLQWRSYLDNGVEGIGIGTHCRGLLDKVQMHCFNFMKQAKTFFETHPITRVLITGKEPAVYLEDSERLLYGWSKSWIQDVPINDYEIPICRIRLMPRGDKWQNGYRRWWYDREKAKQALSRACVQYGRSFAGLRRWNGRREMRNKHQVESDRHAANVREVIARPTIC